MPSLQIPEEPKLIRVCQSEFEEGRDGTPSGTGTTCQPYQDIEQFR